MGAQHGCRSSENRIADGLLWVAMSASGNKARTRAPKATRAFGWRGRRTTCGLRQRWPSSKPFAASAIAPGPFRGWGRQPLACIHTQREPDVSPAGTGTDYPRPKGPPHGSLGGKPSGSPSWPKQDTPIKGMAVGAIRGAVAFSPRCPMAGRRGAHRCRRRRALGVPRNAGRLPHHRGRGWQGRGMRRRQVGLGTARRFRGPSRLLAEDSSGSVPVQSG